LWGDALLREMQRYNHQAGFKIVGETLPQERNRVTLADEKDQYGFCFWISSSFHLRFHPLMAFSRAIAASIVACCSNQTSRCT
jgi:hypothetical protein